MKDIFANLYHKVVSFFHQTENNDSNAKDVACNRLKLVLMQDRTNLSPAIMDRMRRELIDLLSKYLELDRDLLDLNFEQEDSQMALMLSIPVVRAKSEEEILEILKQEEAEADEDEETEEESETDETEESEEDAEDKTEKTESEESEAETKEESETDSEEENNKDSEEEETEEKDSKKSDESTVKSK